MPRVDVGSRLARFNGQRSIAIAAVIAAVFVGSLDQTVIVTVLPAVVTDLEIPFDRIDQAAWIVSGYLLGYTIALPLMGRFADLRGRRLSFVLALAAFAVGSLGCALAGTLGSLVVARFVQAIGGGALLPVAIAIVSDRYPPHRRALAIGLVGAVAEAGGVLGPLYGAWIVNWLSWRWIFWLNVPIALVFLLGTMYGLCDPPRPSGRLDLVGAGFIAAALAFVIVGLVHEPIGPGGIDVRPGLLVLAPLALAAFVWWELRTPEPLLDLRIFRNASFAGAIGGGVLLGGALIVAMVDVPLYAATVLSATPAAGGLLLMRLTALIPIGAIVGGILSVRLGLAAPSGAGFVLAAVGLMEMSHWGVAPSEQFLWLSLGLAGLGFGLMIAPLSTAAVNASGSHREASAAAIFTVARLTGMTLGLSVLTGWGLQRFDDLVGALPLPLPRVGESAAQAQKELAAYNQALLTAGAEVYREIFLVAALLCLIGVVSVAFIRSSHSAPQATE